MTNLRDSLPVEVGQEVEQVEVFEASSANAPMCGGGW